MASLATQESNPETSADSIAAIAGRGTIYITGAKIWFMVSGYGIAITLTYLLTPEDYGIYKVVINTVSIINAVIVTGTYQTVSRYIAQEEAKADSVKAKALALQVYVGGAAALGFFFLAPGVARFLNDSRLTNYLRLASLITLAYAFYSVYTGYFNGQRKFLLQASLDAAYSTLKLAFIIAFVWMGFGVMGGVGGFALAAICVLALSVLLGRGAGRKGEVKQRDLFKFQSYLLLFTFVLTLLQKVDLMLIKSLSSPDARMASENAAFYGASIDVANLTYQIIISITFVIFPLVSRSTFEDDRGRTQSYISNTLRYSIMIMALTATVFSANANEVLKVIYREAYQAGASALSIIAFGMLFFGLLYVLTTIISASGHPRVSLMVGVMTLGASAVLNAVLIPRFGLVGAAAATTASMLMGVLAACAYLGKSFGGLMPFWSAVRIATCAGAVYGVSLLLAPSSKVIIIAKLLALSVFYVLALIVSGEIGRSDLRTIARVIKGK